MIKVNIKTIYRIKMEVNKKIALLIPCLLFVASLSAQTTISGNVFNDGNNDGIKNVSEVGFPFLTVKAFAPGSSTPTITVTTQNTPINSIGNFELIGLSSGVNYRIEFEVPLGYYSTSNGIGSKSSVQFAMSGSTNINFGIKEKNTCNSSNATPKRIVYGTLPRSFFGYPDYNSLNSISYYDHTPGRVSQSVVAPTFQGGVSFNSIGIPFALTTRRTDNKIFLTTVSGETGGPFTPSPDGPSAIYVVDYDGGSTHQFQSYKLLAKLTDLGINVSNQFPISAGHNNIGEFGLGGITISDDNNFLYVVNMGNGKLIKIDITGISYTSIPSNGFTSTTQLPVTEITIPNSVSNCSNGIFRPSVVKYHGGKLFIAGICDASSSSTDAGLYAKIIEYDISNNSFSVVFSNDLTGILVGGFSEYNKPQSKWKYPFGPFGGNQMTELQPIFSDIAFDDMGGLNFSIVSRQVFSNASNNQPGYIMRTWKQADGTYILESDRSSGPLSSIAEIANFPAAGNNHPANFNYDNGGNGIISGPKWFYEQGINGGGAPWDANLYLHPYSTNGGMLIIPGTGELLTGSTDPVGPGETGIRFYDWKNGAVKYGSTLQQSKAFALTGMEAVCDINPIEIGNRVWNDVNGNGIQDGNESGIEGVTICLFDINNVQVSSAITDVNGNYIFSKAAGTSSSSFKYGLALETSQSYKLKICNVGTTATSLGYSLTNITNSIGEVNGQINTGTTLSNSDAFLLSGLPTINMKTGQQGDNNHTYDFGFYLPPPCPVPNCGTATSIKN